MTGRWDTTRIADLAGSAEWTEIDLLINNAGIMMNPPSTDVVIGGRVGVG